MSTIPNLSLGGFNPSQMMHKMNDNFKAADTDGSNTLTKSELTNAISSKGMDLSHVDKIFDQMDADGNGEVSLQEHQDMLAEMEQRMSSLIGGENAKTESGFDSIKTLLETIEASTKDDDQKKRLNEMLEKMQSNDFSESDLSGPISLLTSMLRPIDATV